MSLLITGGTGYIGKKLVQQLRKKNSNVYSIGIEDLNLLNYGDTLNFLKENNIKKIIHLGWSMSNENSAIYDNIEAMSNLIKSCEEVQIEKFIFASTKDESITPGEMIYISYVFDPNKKYNFQGWATLDDATIDKYKNLFFFRSLNQFVQTEDSVDLVSITGTFPNMSNENIMYYSSNSIDALNSKVQSNTMLNKWFSKVNLSNVEVLGDRLFENWYGEIPMYMIGKCTNLKVVPQSLYHSSFSSIIKLEF